MITYICMYIYVCICIYIYIYIYTHTHTCSQLQLWRHKPWQSGRWPRHSTGPQKLMLLIFMITNYWSMGVVSHSQWLSDLDLHLPISCAHVSLHSFLLGFTQTTSFLTLSESLREANAHSLKMFSSENFLIFLLFLSDNLEWKIYRPFLWGFLWHLKLLFPCVPCYIVIGDWSTVE